jgi:hypothetical protein
MELGAPGGAKGRDPKEEMRRALSDRIEDNLGALLARAESLLMENRKHILAVAHALETYKTLSGNDVHAVIEGRTGDVINGAVYFEPTNLAKLEEYHQSALQAHKEHRKPDLPLPIFG